MFNKIVIICTIIIGIFFVSNLITIRIDYMKKSFINSIILNINAWMKKKEEHTRTLIFKEQMPPLLLKWNYLLNDLKINITLFQDIPLIHFKFILYTGTIFAGAVLDLVIFTNIALIIPMIAIVFILTLCYLYSKTVRRRYARLVDSITTENLLTANIELGIIADIKLNINNIPTSIRKEYDKFIYNVEKLNYGTEDALKILDLDTGCYSSEFLNNVNIYENYRQEGFVNIFKDCVELNNIKILARDKMEAIMRRVSFDFLGAFLISYGFLILELITVNIYRAFYFKTTIGQILFIGDLVLLVIVYLRFSIIRAKEL